jgi:hypothetical protein
MPLNLNRIAPAFCPHDGMTYHAAWTPHGCLVCWRTRGRERVVDSLRIVTDPVAIAAHLNQMVIWTRIATN